MMVPHNPDTNVRCTYYYLSEVVHRVTRVTSALEPRMSLIMAFQPANPFQPDKTVLDTWERFDVQLGSAPYEFYRLKARNVTEPDNPHATEAKPIMCNRGCKPL